MRPKRSIGLLFLFAFTLSTQAQISRNEPYIGISISSQKLSSDRALSYTYHRFDPNLFAGFAHEHFNVDPFEGMTEQHSSRQLIFYYPFGEVIDLQISIPHNYYSRTSNNEFFEYSNGGFGDIKLGGSYQWYNSAFKTGKEGFKMRLGANVDFPTGQYEAFTEEGELEPQVQAGKGALGVKVYHLIQRTRGDIEFSNLTSYQYYNANRYGYQFGAGLSNRFDFTYIIGDMDNPVRFSAGAVYSRLNADIMNDRTLLNRDESGEDTGGQWIDIFGRIEVHWGPVVFSIEGVSRPIWQDLWGQQPIRGRSTQMGIYYLIKKRSTFNE